MNKLDHVEGKGEENGKAIISNNVSGGLTSDDEGSLYLPDWEKHEVRRYGRRDGKHGIIAAGGYGRDAALSVYVSDSGNHRVMKWMRDVRGGAVVAGGRSSGSSLGLLNNPSGIFVDRMGSVYVADQGNLRVMRWVRGAKEEVLMGISGRGALDNQCDRPTSIVLDRDGNLLVVDRNNDRVQRFDLQ